MIQYEIRREPNHNYLVPIVEEKQDEYSVHMITENQMPGYLNVKAERMNMQTTLCYDITSMQSIETMFTRRELKCIDITRIMQGIRTACDSAQEYLLCVEDIALQPSLIYMEPENGQVKLCYIPEYQHYESNGKQLIAEFILRHLDHEDREAVGLGYGFYEQICKENTGLARAVEQTLKLDNIYEKRSSVVAPEDHTPYQRQIKINDIDVALVRDENNISQKQAEKNEIDAEHRQRGKRGKRNKNTRSGLRKNDPEVIQKQIVKKDDIAGIKRKKLRTLWLWIIFIVVMIVVYAGCIWLWHLDLTQMGGLAFLLIAVFWLVYGTISGKENINNNIWADSADEEDHEDAFMQQLMSECYPSGERNAMPWEIMDTQTEPGQYAAEKKINEDSQQQIYGQTRMLRMQDVPNVTLVSSNMRYPNLKVVGEVCLIGKQANSVDLVLPANDALSRIHAKLECTDNGMYITDMNSSNGTKVNGELIREKRQICEGDCVSFAGFEYIVRVD